MLRIERDAFLQGSNNISVRKTDILRPNEIVYADRTNLVGANGVGLAYFDRSNFGLAEEQVADYRQLIVSSKMEHDISRDRLPAFAGDGSIQQRDRGLVKLFYDPKQDIIIPDTGPYHNQFYQAPDVNGRNNEQRLFGPLPAGVLEHAVTHRFITAGYGNARWDNDKPVFVGLHLIKCYGDCGELVNTTPEGPHWDGFRYVLTACIANDNIAGGHSEVYRNPEIHTENKKETEVLDCLGKWQPYLLLRRQMGEMEAVLIKDDDYRHHVQTIQAKEIGPYSRVVMVATFHDWEAKCEGMVCKPENAIYVGSHLN